MLDIAYTKGQELQRKIDILEEARRDLHVAPISKKAYYHLAWDATLTRIENTLRLSGTVVNKREIYKALTSGKPQTETAERISRYKKALDYIRNDWYVTHENISPQAVATIDSLTTKGAKLSRRVPSQALYDLKHLINYLQSGNEHPVIQAGIVYVGIIRKDIDPSNAQNLTTLLAYMFLYKYGWDFRELLTLEKAFVETQTDYQYALQTTKETNNAAVWLDYFVLTLTQQVHNILAHVRTYDASSHPRGITPHLSPRHYEIISQLDDPRARITNKQVQKRFGISQITASRDLSTLTLMGLLASHGKGRSTYYTKV